MILITFLHILGIITFCVQPVLLTLWTASPSSKNQEGCKEKGCRAGAPPTYRGDEPVQRLPSLRVLDRDGAKVIAEPDGRDDPSCVAVGYVLLGWRRGKGGHENQTYKPRFLVGGRWTAEGPLETPGGSLLSLSWSWTRPPTPCLSPLPLEALL